MSIIQFKVSEKENLTHFTFSNLWKQFPLLNNTQLQPTKEPLPLFGTLNFLEKFNIISLFYWLSKFNTCLGPFPNGLHFGFIDGLTHCMDEIRNVFNLLCCFLLGASINVIVYESYTA